MFPAYITSATRLLLIALLVSTSSANAKFDLESSMIANPAIGVNELGYRLTPLTKPELIAAADHWQMLLQQHLQNTAETQIKITTADEDSKQQLLENLNISNEQQTLLIDRVTLVLDELQKKGGNITEYQNYIDAVSGPKAEVEDTNALASTVSGWLQSDEGGMRWATNIALFLVTLLIFKMLASIFASITNKAVSHLNDASD